MRVLIIRHAAAVPSGTPGIADDDRPLTPKGAAKFRVAATGLARIADRPDVLLAALRHQPREATVAIVGHEPVLGALLARLLGAPEGEQFPFKKGGAALVDLPQGPSGGARLIWFLKPKILRALAHE